MRLSKLHLSWNIFFLFLFVIILCVVVVGEFALNSLHDFYLRSQQESLTSITQLARRQVHDLLQSPAGSDQANALAKEISRESNTRITIILSDGRVIADSEEDPSRMENHANRPEIQAALQGRMEPAQRFSRTLGADMLYLAAPVIHDGRIIGVVRAARALSEIGRRESSIRSTLWRSCLVGVLIAGLASLYMARRISRPIERIRLAAERYAKGDYSKRLFIDRPPEYADLAKAMNRMAREMDRRLREITRQRNELEAILSSMREGVFAVDQQERLIMLNPAAEDVMNIHAAEVVGHLVQEALRHADLQRFISRALAGETISAEDSLLRWPGEKLLQVGSAPLRNEEGKQTGLLVVLNDVTRLHMLENLRRDFVANVSHELRTPITSIKGFIETLRDGAMKDPENAQRFLDIITRQADRLNAIIEDLLSLSRIERQSEQGNIELSSCNLQSLLQNTLQQFEPRCTEKDMRISLECPPDLTVSANAPLLEQAIGNLLDNAIKYSPSGKAIHIAASSESGKVQIRVSDEGFGIAPEHLHRLFERFYRVDTARSRAAGGTGLGLSIVKHIAQAHGGQVTVESEPGKGSIFTIQLPHAS